MKNEDYKLIPMSEITDEARKIAVAWMECEDKNWIGQKHKLASDIMNYARQENAKLIAINKKQAEYLAYLKRAIHSESIIDNITAGVRDKFDAELSSLRAKEKEVDDEDYRKHGRAT